MKRMLAALAILQMVVTVSAQRVESEQSAIEQAADFLNEVAPHLAPVQLSAKRETYVLTDYDIWWVEGSNGECSLTIRVRDGSVTSYVDYLSESTIQPEGTRSVRGEDEAGSLARVFIQAMSPSFSKFQVTRYSSLGSAGEPSPNAPVVDVMLAERVPGYEGNLNEAFVRLDAIRARVLSATVSDLYQFDSPKRLLTRDEAVGFLRTAWKAEAAYYARHGTDLPWPGDDACMSHAKTLVYPPAGAHAFSSEYGALLEHERRARVCWTFGHGRFSVAVDAEDGRLVRSDLSKQATSRPGYGEPGYGAITPEVREHLRRAPERDRRQLLQFVAWIAVPSSVAIGIYLWMRRVNKSVLD